MQKKLTTLNICGLEVELFITDDPETLGENEDILSFGKYNVNSGMIWLDSSLSPTMMQSCLFHEIYEFVLGYFNVTLSPENGHGTFMRMSNNLWLVFKTNQDILFGNGMAKLINEKETT